MGQAFAFLAHQRDMSTETYENPENETRIGHIYKTHSIQNTRMVSITHTCGSHSGLPTNVPERERQCDQR